MKNINIAFSFDQNYYRQGCVAISSFLDNLKNDVSCNIYCLCVKDVKDASKFELEKIVKNKSKKAQIYFITLDDSFDLSFEVRGITKAAYSRLLLHKLLPNVDKIIYADVDVLFKGDLSGVYEKDLGHNLLGVVKAPTINLKQTFDDLLKEHEYWENELRDVRGKYFNSGFLLMNLKKIRESGMEAKWIEMSKKDYYFVDQDILNITCKDRVVFLPAQYNVFGYIQDSIYEELIGENIFSRKELEDLHNNPIMLHWAGEKPWNNKNIPRADEWWDYVRDKTPFGEYFKEYQISLKRKKKGVIYTCLIGNYDVLLNHAYINPEWDYVCFTDDISIRNGNNSSWELRPLVFEKLDDVRNQRWHKLHPHLLFPEYGCSLYVDTNINILNDGIFRDIEKLESQKISLGPHFKRKNIYEEFDACKVLGKDDKEVIERQRELMKKEDFPGEYGVFFENNIIFREHHDEDVKKIMNDWWWWIENHSRRDQLSLTYVLWKHKMELKPLAEITYRNSDKVEFRYGEQHITKEELIFQNKKLQKENKRKDLDIKQLEYALTQKDKQLALIVSSLRWKVPNYFYKIYKKNIKRYTPRFVFRIKNIITDFVDKLLNKGFAPDQCNHELWIKNNENWDKKVIEKEIKNFRLKPKISIITPVYNVDPKWLDKCIQSVVDQFYGNWELCLHDDASTKKETIECLKKWEKADSRIRVSYGKENQHISGASNDALKIATGEFVALLDNDDEFSPVALYENVKLINKHPEVDFIYSDEDKLEIDGTRTEPCFKPNWSLDLFLEKMYTCHLGVYRKEIVDKIGGFRKGFEGSQDYDLVLRFIEKTNEKNIVHIPKILYHWRKLPSSTANSSAAKQYAYDAGKKAIQEYLQRNSIAGNVVMVRDGEYEIRK